MGTTLLIGSAMSLLCVGGGILFWVGAWRDWCRWSNLVQHLVVVEGSLLALESRERTVRRNESRSDETITEYWARYRYTYEGQTYKGQQSISKNHYRTWKRGMPLTVRLPSNQPEDGSFG
jgi:membrane protein implicated in regulation of membrane protease activity